MAEECADCGATFSSPSDLIDHMKTAHAGGDASASMAMNPMADKPGLECALCGAVFRTRRELAAHNLQPHAVGATHPVEPPEATGRAAP